MQPRSRKLSVTILITILLAILGTLSSFLSNLATSRVPVVLLPYLLWAWPAFLVVAVLGFLVTIWQARHEASAANPPSLPIQPEHTSLTDLLEPLTENPTCAWVIAWQGGRRLTNIELKYDDLPDASLYTSVLQDDLLHVIENWGQANLERYQELREQAECTSVRLKRARQHHPSSKFCIWLEPTEHLYYVSIHSQLGKPHLKSLRKKYFGNALMGLESGQPLVLPSNFALHVAVVSKDRYLLLRQRSSSASNYPKAWEAGVGEFMHGPGPMSGPIPEVRADPGHSVFRHFSKERIPDLFLFLRNAIAEELGYSGAKRGDFCLYGFAVEYQSLGPKLLAVYNSDRTIDELLEKAGKDVKDPARALSKIELTPSAIAEAFSNGKYTSWEPKSKLLVLLALKQDLETTGKYDQSLEIASLMERFKIEGEPDDPWEYPVEVDK